MLILSSPKIKKARPIVNIPHYANKVSTQQRAAINMANFTVTVVSHRAGFFFCKSGKQFD